jgi:hypothetical protein
MLDAGRLGRERLALTTQQAHKGNWPRLTRGFFFLAPRRDRGARNVALLLLHRPLRRGDFRFNFLA